MRENLFLSKEVKLKRVRKGFAIAFPVVIIIFVIGNYYINLIDDTLRNYYVVEKQDKVLGVMEEDITIVFGMDEMKRRLSALIPKDYEVIEAENDFPGIYDDGCVSIYELYPKDYSELEKKYLDYGYIHYCKDINTASLGSQIGEVRYKKEKDAWYYFEDKYNSDVSEEMRLYGSKLVTITEVWGSHHSWDAYIVRVDNSNEVIVILIPQATRIRCEEYDESWNEIWKEDCVEFLKSFGYPSTGNAWVFDEVYNKDYWDLLDILQEI